jgi:hypothetical protein
MTLSITIIAAFFFLLAPASVRGQTVTQGTFERIRAIGEKVSTELDSYVIERDSRLKDLDRIKLSIKNSQAAYSKTSGRKERLHLQARILASSSELVEGYLDLYGLATKKMEEIIPNLRWMKEAAASGALLGPVAQQIHDPQTRRQLSSLYSNLANLSLLLDDKALQGDVAPLLKANEELFEGYNLTKGVFENVAGNLDRVIKYYSDLYAKTTLAHRKLQQKKQKLLIANNLMAFVIAVGPAQDKILELSGKGGMDIPEMDVNLDEITDLIVRESTGPERDEDFYIPNPDGKPDLVRYRNEGPSFVKGGRK